MPATSGKRLQEYRRDRVGDHGRVLADGAQRQRHRHRRADGVAVGPLMRRDDEAPAAAIASIRSARLVWVRHS